MLPTIVTAVATALWIASVVKTELRIKKQLKQIDEIEDRSFEKGVRQGAFSLFNALKANGIIPERAELEMEAIVVRKPKQPGPPPCSDKEFLKSVGVKF